MKTRKLLITLLLLSCAIITGWGQTWVQQNSATTADLLAVQFLDANNGFACGNGGTVLKTTNGGSTWTAINISTSNPVNEVYFVNPNEGWAAAGDPNNSSASGQIWHTTNGGSTWTQQTPSTTEARFGLSFANSSTGWVVGSRNGPINIDATINGGTTWTNQSDNNIFGWLYKVDAVSSTTAFSIGGAFFPSVSGFIIKTTNGGANWTQNNTGTIPFLNGMDMVDATNGYVAGDAGTIMATTNGGTSWSTQVSGTTDTLQDISFVSVARGWACGFSGTIRRTVNGGNNWTGEISGITQHLNGIHALDTTTVWAVGNGGKIIKRTLGTGIGPENNEFFSLNVYPNPCTDLVTISAELPSGIKDPFVCITDLTGRVIIREELQNGSLVIPAGELAKGIYSCTLSASGIRTSVIKLIVK